MSLENMLSLKRKQKETEILKYYLYYDRNIVE